MLRCDLRQFKCPQQFVQFKLGLKKAQLAKQTVIFAFDVAHSNHDMLRFLDKHHYQYRLDLNLGELTVEPVCV